MYLYKDSEGTIIPLKECLNAKFIKEGIITLEYKQCFREMYFAYVESSGYITDYEETYSTLNKFIIIYGVEKDLMSALDSLRKLLEETSFLRDDSKIIHVHTSSFFKDLKIG